ncbi:putative transcription factor Nin-like family [Helianthus annuus]|uniref:Putative PB1 domain, RWP-RK domain, Lambda repressor-like, DNA-binding domain protein n=1 Tax=Helianthus annuus TaxID=4232 RepID=A0A251UHP6_HELAN|nr:protein NLP3 [Helianthus annuus]KAF5801644.1 putative transcription factor Nin-like family [Helianthus annuus]KAJ0566060.1 putative transcription factor Nin-like family [Helianthus annuus]KAJ0911120.1 putative transcription factor Nin-like family [Helianthus annuus]
MNMSTPLDPVASSESKVLDALKSRYTCIHEPLPVSASADYYYSTSSDNNNQRYLTSLRVFGSREVEEPTSSSNLVVDQNIIDPQIIKEKVTAALKVLSFREPRVLVQFWSPVAVMKRCLLTTLDQPFGLGAIDEGLYKYRLESEQRVFVVDGEHREELGPPGRVYRQKLPEWSLDMHGYINLPVFEPRSGCCVGVLELITSSKYTDYAFEVRQVSRALKEENLKSPNVLEDTSFYARAGDEKRQLELDEIFRTLKTVCDIHNIPLAQTWGPCGYSSVVASSGNLERSCSSFSRNCIGKVCMSTAALPFYVRDLSMWGFHETCRSRHLDNSQGIVGRSLSSHGLCFCGDVSKLGEDEYPLVAYARMHGITSCLAIYLKGPEVDGEYVIELFLSTQNENETDLQSLVKTVKQHLKNASRIELGDISSPQVIGGIPLTWNLESPTLTEKREVPPDLENLNLLAENGNNDCNVDVACSKQPSESNHVDHMDEDKPSNSAAAGANEKDVDINAGGLLIKEIDYSEQSIRKKIISLEEDKPSNSAAAGTNPNVVVPYMDVGTQDVDINTGKRSGKYIDFSNEPIRKRKRTDKSISLEEIRKYYGKTMEEAAESLHVSRSTLKRICRSHGIPRWPYSRTPNETDPLLNPDQTDAAAHASDRALTTLVLGTSNATNATHDPATLTQHNKHTSQLVLHPTERKDPPDGRAKPETTVKDKHIKNAAANTYTIKVTYRKDTVKFSFRLSDGLAKLEKLVATRFQLSDGSFSLKYEDEDGDIILIACDNDLTASLGAFRQPDAQTVVRLSVWPIASQNPDA